MKTAAAETAKICKQYNLEVIDFQPILNYEGILDKKEHAERLDELCFRMDVRRSQRPNLRGCLCRATMHDGRDGS